MALRVGIVGSGFGGSVHAPAYALHPAFEPVAIASPNRAAQVAHERKIPHAFASLDEMLAGVELDVVSIASPPFDHHRSVLAALRARKHVLCEKPFALNLTQAEEMTAAALEAGTVCAIAHEFRYTPARHATRELIANGHLGAVRQIEVTAYLSMLRAGDTSRTRGWWFDRTRGGGITGAVGVHLVDLATYLAGRPPIRTDGFTRIANPQRRDAGGEFTSTVDDGMAAVLDYGEGTVARVTVDATLWLRQATVAVHGEERSAVASGEWLIDQTLYALDAGEQSELELAPPRYARYAPVHTNIPAFLELLDAFADRIAGGDAELPTFEEALVTQRVLERIGYTV